MRGVKNMKVELRAATEKIMVDCIECGLCADACSFLSQVGSSPAEMAQRGITLEEAYSCTLCRRCESVCPEGLSPVDMFAARRTEAIATGEIDVEECSYLLPDQEENFMSIYRSYYGIDYSDIAAGDTAETCFFPGCTLMTYAPGLTREVYRRLQESCGCQGMLTDCCGKPLEQMGLLARSQKLDHRLAEQVQQKGIKRLVTACPGCYYKLREIFQPLGVKILTVYEVLDLKEGVPDLPALCTVHDSCPDRQEGIFAEQVREALRKAGYSLVEMTQNRNEAPCCGSGGQISHFRPDLAEELVQERLAAASETETRILVGYCLSCVLNFARIPSRLLIRHALNLLLGYDEDYAGIKARAAQIYEAADAEESQA